MGEEGYEIRLLNEKTVETVTFYERSRHENRQGDRGVQGAGVFLLFPEGGVGPLHRAVLPDLSVGELVRVGLVQEAAGFSAVQAESRGKEDCNMWADCV